MAVLDGERGQDDLDPLERLVAQHLLVDGEIAVGPRGQPAGQLVVADERRIVLFEGRVAEHVVGMHVGIDHVADRLVGHRANGASELAPRDRAAQRVDHRDRVAADHEARIGHVAAILRRLQLVASLMHEYAGRDLADLQPLGCLCRHVSGAGETAASTARRAGSLGARPRAQNGDLRSRSIIGTDLRRLCVKYKQRCLGLGVRCRNRATPPLLGPIGSGTGLKPRLTPFYGPCRAAGQADDGIMKSGPEPFLFAARSYTLRQRKREGA